MAPIKATYTLSENEFVEAQRVYRTRIARSRWIKNALPLIGLAIVAMVFLTGLHRNLGPALLALLIGLVFVFYPAAQKLRARRAFEESSLSKQCNLEADDTGLKLAGQPGASEMKWTDFHRSYETSHLWLLFTETPIFYPIPKRAFQGEELLRFRDLVRQKVPRAKRATGALATAAALFVLWAVVVVVFGGMVSSLVTSKISKVRGLNRTSQKRKPVPENAATRENLHASAKIYFVPLDDDSQRQMAKLVPYYQSKYGLEIEMLPTLPYQAWTEDPSRKQAIGEELIAEIRHAYPEVADNFQNAVLALTSRDMYMLDRLWDFTYNIREDERIAVVSSRRLDPTYFHQPADEALFETRVRKLITKNLGILCFHLQLSGNPYSVLYYDFDGPQDVDTASEDYLESDAKWYTAQQEKDGDPCLIIRHYHAEDGSRTDNASLETCGGGSREPGQEVFEIDLRYGLFIDQRTDFLLPGVLPIELTRVFRTQDVRSRAFGIGGNHSLNIFPVGDSWPFSWVDLILGDGYRVHYERTSFGLGYWDAVYRARGGSFYDGSELKWNWPGWKLTLSNGTTYFFPPANERQSGEQIALIGVKDAEGNVLKFVRLPSGELTSVSSANHRLDLTYDGRGHVTRAQDDEGHAFSYSYQGDRLSKVVDDAGRDVEYVYDDNDHPLQVKEYGSKPILTAGYTGDMVSRLALPSGARYHFQYSTDRRGNVIDVFVSDAFHQIADVHLKTRSYSRGFVIRSAGSAPEQSQSSKRR